MFMRLLINASYGPSLINFRGPLIRKLVERGVEVIACAPEDSQVVRSGVEALGAQFCRIPLKRTGKGLASDLEYFRQLRILIRRTRPQIVLSYTIKPVIYGSLAAAAEKVPLVCAMITGMGAVFASNGMKMRILRFAVCILMRLALARCHVVFFQNVDDFMECRQRRLLVDTSKVKVLAGSGVDLRHFCYVQVQPVHDNGISFLLIARMLREKGIREFVEAVRLLRAKWPVRATVVGPPDANPSSISAAELSNWQREGLITYVPGVDDVRPFLADCHVFVLPSYYREGTPRTVLEAMAMGRAIVTTDMPGCRETVRLTQGAADLRGRGISVMEGENGFLVRPRDVGALADAMSRFVREQRLVRDMGRRSFEIVVQRFDVRKVNAEILEVLGL